MDIETFEGLKGQTLTAVENTGEEIRFTLANGEQYELYHPQDCCESVYVEDVAGELDDLIGTPLLLVEEASNSDTPPPESDYSYESYTWTFYKLVTMKGAVTIRFFGSSNGYYSESVYFRKL
jgi:hypothetical protein